MASYPVRDTKELQQILAKMDQKNPLISMLLEFCVRSGLRYGDATKLKFSDVMVNGVVRSAFDVVQSKGYNMRRNRTKNPASHKAASTAAKITIHVSEEFKDLIRQIHDFNGKHTLMFQSNHHLAKKGSPISSQYVNRVLKEIAIELQLPYQLSTHSMRKTLAMLLLNDRRATVKNIKDALGHSSIAVTDHYLQTFHDETAQFTTGISIPTVGELLDDSSK